MKRFMFSAVADDHGRRWLVSYDVPGDADRAAVSRVLSAYGERVQYSVFVCWLTVRERRRLVRELAAARCLRNGAADLRIHPLWAVGPVPRRSDAEGAATFWMA